MLALSVKAKPKSSSFTADGKSTSSSRSIAADNDDDSSKNKTRKIAAISGTTTVGTAASDDWCFKYRPKSTAELPIQKAKIDSVRRWISSSLSAKSVAEQEQLQEARTTSAAAVMSTITVKKPAVLALCGNSGCGKSAMVELVCKEMGVDVLPWTDDMWSSDYSASSEAFTYRQALSMNSSGWGPGGGSSGVENTTASSIIQAASLHLQQQQQQKQPSYSGHSEITSQIRSVRDLFSLDDNAEYYSGSGGWRRESQYKAFGGSGGGGGGVRNDRKDAELQRFAVQSNYPSLSLSSASSTNTSSTAPPLPASAKRVVTSTETTSFTSAGGKANNNNNNKIILIHDPPAAALSFDSSSNSGRAGGLGEGSSSSFTAAAAAHERLNQFILQCEYPVIIIVSALSGRDDFHYASERVLPRSVRRRINFEAMYIPPTTDAKVTKILSNILKMERVASSSSSSPTVARCSESVLNDIVACGSGDIRHAITQLRLLSVPAGLGPQRSSSPVSVKAFRRADSCNSSINTSSSRGRSDMTGPDTTLLGKRPASKAVPECISLLDSDDDSNGGNDGGDHLHLHQVGVTGHVTKNNKSNIHNSTATVSTAATAATSAGGGILYRSASTGSSAVSLSSSAVMAPMLSVAANAADKDRDNSWSALHTVAKLLGCRLNARGKVTKLGFSPDEAASIKSNLSLDLLLSFLQWNSISSISYSNMCLAHAPRHMWPDAVAVRCRTRKLKNLKKINSVISSHPLEPSHQQEDREDVEVIAEKDQNYDDDEEEEEEDEQQEQYPLPPEIELLNNTVDITDQIDLLSLEMMSKALDTYSDVDLLASIRYDTNARMFRDDTFFPEVYCYGLCGRAVSVSRGTGFDTAYEFAKNKGFSGTFRGVFKPKILELRTNSKLFQGSLQRISWDIFHHENVMYNRSLLMANKNTQHSSSSNSNRNSNSNSSDSNSPYLPSVRELSQQLIPYYRLIQANRTAEVAAAGTTAANNNNYNNNGCCANIYSNSSSSQQDQDAIELYLQQEYEQEIQMQQQQQQLEKQQEKQQKEQEQLTYEEELERVMSLYETNGGGGDVAAVTAVTAGGGRGEGGRGGGSTNAIPTTSSTTSYSKSTTFTVNNNIVTTPFPPPPPAAVVQPFVWNESLDRRINNIIPKNSVGDDGDPGAAGAGTGAAGRGDILRDGGISITAVGWERKGETAVRVDGVEGGRQQLQQQQQQQNGLGGGGGVDNELLDMLEDDDIVDD